MSQILQTTALIEGLLKLKKSALIFIIGTILCAGGLITGLFLLGAATMKPTVETIEHPYIEHVHYEHMVISETLLAAAIFIPVICGIIGCILLLIGLFVYLIPAFDKLREYDYEKFRIAATLVKVGLTVGTILLIIGFMIIVSGGLTLNIALAYGGELLLVVAYILLVIGYIGIIVGMFKLEDVTKETLFLVSGILFILAIFFPVISFIAWIILYLACRGTLKKLQFS